MNRLRNRLILIFLAATLAPLLATVWITSAGSQHLLDFSTTAQLESISKSLEQTGREFYQRSCDDLKRQAENGQIAPRKFLEAQRASWPESVRAFAASGEAERFVSAGNEGDRLDLLVRHGSEVHVYSEALDGVAMDRLSQQIADARTLVETARESDFRRGFRLTYILLVTSFWLVSLALLVYLSHRVSRPIHQLTNGLTELAAGDLDTRVPAGGNDEVFSPKGAAASE